jgi:hypothetical protein
MDNFKIYTENLTICASRFQFQNGSIKRCAEAVGTSSVARFSFNSKMVRLKVYDNPQSEGKFWFQFQNGSIKSCRFYLLYSIIVVSIPKWFD